MPRLLSQCTTDVERQQLRHLRVVASRNRQTQRGGRAKKEQEIRRWWAKCEATREWSTWENNGYNLDGPAAG